MHFGYRSTFHDSISTEVYLHKFNGDLYWEKLTVTVHKKIRDIIEFSSKAKLQAQIEDDMKYLK